MARVKNVGELDWVSLPNKDVDIYEVFQQGNLEIRTDLEFSLVLDVCLTRWKSLDYGEMGRFNKDGTLDIEYLSGSEEEKEEKEEGEPLLPLPVQLMLSALVKHYDCDEITSYVFLPDQGVVYIRLEKALTGPIRSYDRFLHALARKLSKWVKEAERTSSQRPE